MTRRVMKMTKYSIEKHEKLNKWIVWKETNIGKGISVRGIFQGTRKECEEFLKEKGGK